MVSTGILTRYLKFVFAKYGYVLIAYKVVYTSIWRLITMSKSCITLYELDDGQDAVFATADFWDDSLLLGTNFVPIQELQEVRNKTQLCLNESQRKRLQKFLNTCWPSDE